jgi:hypothetical protein
MEIVNNLDIDIWKKYVDNHPQGNIFHTPEIFEVFKNAKDFHPEIWAVIDNQRCLKALFLPVRISYLGSVLPDFTTRAVSYGSFLLDQSKDGLKALSILLKEYLNSKRNSIVFTEIRNLYDFGHLKEIIAREGFIFENYLTYLIDLNMSREKLFNKIGKRTRKHIRRAIRQKDISINEVKDRSMVSEVYDLLKKHTNTQRYFWQTNRCLNLLSIFYNPQAWQNFLLQKKTAPLPLVQSNSYTKTPCMVGIRALIESIQSIIQMNCSFGIFWSGAQQTGIVHMILEDLTIFMPRPN